MNNLPPIRYHSTNLGYCQAVSNAGFLLFQNANSIMDDILKGDASRVSQLLESLAVLKNDATAELESTGDNKFFDEIVSTILPEISKTYNVKPGEIMTDITAVSDYYTEQYITTLVNKIIG